MEMSPASAGRLSIKIRQWKKDFFSQTPFLDLGYYRERKKERILHALFLPSSTYISLIFLPILSSHELKQTSFPSPTNPSPSRSSKPAMEFSPVDESKTSSDETDRSDDMVTVARSYGCVFCKRGFTTAQALGGHMNIHRKDRAKTRPSSLPPPIFDESYGSLRLTYPYNYTYPSSGFDPHHQVRYPVFFPAASTWDIARLSYNSHELPSVHSDPLNRDFFAEDCWRQTLNLQAGPSNIGDNHIMGSPKMGVAEEDIDLELRLGYI